MSHWVVLQVAWASSASLGLQVEKGCFRKTVYTVLAVEVREIVWARYHIVCWVGLFFTVYLVLDAVDIFSISLNNSRSIGISYIDISCAVIKLRNIRCTLWTLCALSGFRIVQVQLSCAIKTVSLSIHEGSLLRTCLPLWRLLFEVFFIFFIGVYGFWRCQYILSCQVRDELHVANWFGDWFLNTLSGPRIINLPIPTTRAFQSAYIPQRCWWIAIHTLFLWLCEWSIRWTLGYIVFRQ